MEQRENPEGGWRIDRRIPFALLVGLMLHLGGVVWWLRAQKDELDDHERRITKIEHVSEERTSVIALLSERLAGIDAKMQVLLLRIPEMRR